MVLNNVSVEANAHAREKFLHDLRKLKESQEAGSSSQQVASILGRMKTRLDNPDVLSVDTVHQFLRKLCLL
jgi:hypothetical protein